MEKIVEDLEVNTETTEYIYLLPRTEILNYGGLASLGIRNMLRTFGLLLKQTLLNSQE